MKETLQDVIKNYRSDAETNNEIFRHFTRMTESHDLLWTHRQHIEQHQLGFGDRAFHYMWFLLLHDLFSRRVNPYFLEIGVYKGQVISLWSLLGRHFNMKCSISCITPLSGNPVPRGTLSYYWKLLTDSKFREGMRSGNFYDQENYSDVITHLFGTFNLDVNEVRIHKGFSTDQSILKSIESLSFDLVYIDGDHTRKGVEADIHNYASKISKDGFLVMDDAACNIPGGGPGIYWKGHQSVSDACEIIPSLGFKNILNVGHNRVYQKL